MFKLEVTLITETLFGSSTCLPVGSTRFPKAIDVASVSSEKKCSIKQWNNTFKCDPAL
jgi:hypothetical protein